MNRYYLSFSFFICVLLTDGLGFAGAEQKFVLNTPGPPPYHNSEQTGILDQWMSHAFKNIGLSVKLEWFPPERCLINANAGLADGDAIRISGLEKMYPNLILVPEKVYDGEFVAFSRTSFPVNGWESLKPYHVGIIRGHKICEANVRDTLSLTRARNTELLFQLLKSKRVDVVVNERIFGMAMIKNLGLKDIIILEPPLARLEFFVYLHRKHETIVPMLAESIKTMKSDGTRDRIFNEGLSRVSAF
ncbi:substrate-binding periplasmic protein [Thermodesulfobacteriota bacterium]